MRDQLNGLLVFGATGHLSDDELLRRFVARRDEGAQAAFAALVERHGAMVLDVCRRVLGSVHEAEDAFQATFLVLARKAASIARPEQLANWLFGVACRTALDARARARRRKAREQRVHAMSRPETKPADQDQQVLDELRATLDEELARLPDRCRAALVLCEFDGLTRRAAARQLGIPEGTLSSRLARAKDLLRRRLVRRGLALSGLALEQALAREAQARTFTVPLSLVDSATRAAAHVAAGAALTEVTSTSIATLAQGVLKAMLLARLKGFVFGLAALAITTAGVGVMGQDPAPAVAGASVAHEGLSDSLATARPPSGSTKQLVLPGSTTLDPTRLARIRARFAPARVVEVAKVFDTPRKGGRPQYRELRPGDSVAKGDVLAVLYSADLASKKNDLLDALVQLMLDQKVFDRVEQNRTAIPEVLVLTQQRNLQTDRNAVNRALNQLNLWDIPQGEIDALHAEAKRLSADNDAWSQNAEGRWVKGEQRAKDGKVDPGRAEESSWGWLSLRAPFDGVVVERNVHKDEMVVDNTMNLFQIADVSRLLVLVNCPENELPSLVTLRGNDRHWTVRTVTQWSGASSSNETEASKGLPGTIDEIGYIIDPNQHTAVLKGYIDNPGKQIRGGQYVTVTITIPPPDDVVEIPADALIDDGKQTLVFVQSDPAQFTLRRVEVTRRLDGKVLVKATPIPKEEHLTDQEARQGLLPKEPLRLGERVLLHGSSKLVADRLGTLERKVDQILEALPELRRPAAKSDLQQKGAPK
jgi:cobalt-zinc-cadmium efflux system membrane fusion protein